MLARHEQLNRTAIQLTAVALEGFLSIGALGGGVALMFGPHSELLPLPTSLLVHAVVHSYFIPGLILFIVIGCGPMTVAVLAWRGHPSAPALTLVVGVALLLWMAVEIAIVGYSSTPPLQPIYIGLGFLIAVGSVWL